MRNKTKRTIAKALTALITAALLTSPASAFVKGDADGNGTLNIRDCAEICRVAAQGDTSNFKEFVDYNKDKQINVRDAAAIAKYLAAKDIKTQLAAQKSATTSKSTSTSTSKSSKAPRSQVYITPTGKKYHYSGSCNGGKYKLVSLDQALKKKLTPCKKCVL